MLERLEVLIMDELQKERSDFKLPRFPSLDSVLEEYFQQYQTPFVFIIDEWDCIFRMKRFTADDQVTYLNFLRNLLKNQSYVALAYMTGILPIKKYGEHSALNMFTEISMTNPREYAEFTGFTEDEVKALCEEYQMPFEETKGWYDGYQVKGVSIYNPRYTARKNYIMHRELPTGKGFADIVYIPRKHVDAPALVIELKHNQPAGTAIEQIKAKNYPAKIAEYTGEILLVGITYDDDKTHHCEIERYLKR